LTEMVGWSVTVLLTRKDPARRACVLARGYSRGVLFCRRVLNRGKNFFDSPRRASDSPVGVRSTGPAAWKSGRKVDTNCMGKASRGAA
jgi:hypothetical protein